MITVIVRSPAPGGLSRSSGQRAADWAATTLEAVAGPDAWQGHPTPNGPVGHRPATPASTGSTRPTRTVSSAGGRAEIAPDPKQYRWPQVRT